ncbi:MAG TPA: hypothetical protein ENN06_02580 [Desulfobacteraceae bacterium]|nr:hypothetical protein [Desulfobacteraceae bacterium]
MMNYLIRALDPLVFRDGRPFGDSGNVSGGMLRWPLPVTIAGMFRTQAGIGRAPDWFTGHDANRRKTNIEAILRVRITGMLPVWRGRGDESWRFLASRPADALVTGGNDTPEALMIHRYKFDKTGDGTTGTDLPWANWLYPQAATMEKPVSGQPDFWHWQYLERWLRDESIGQITGSTLGVPLPKPEIRVHTAIDPTTGTVASGKLFESPGVRFETEAGAGVPQGELGIAVRIDGLDNLDNLAGPCRLGGERRTAIVEPFAQDWPACPNTFEKQSYLRLLLVTPGNFGGWAPSWLHPTTDAGETAWCDIPGLAGARVRLCSAFVPRWQPVSGWDMATRAPKAMRKLVPAGAVYVIEVEQPERSREIAAHLWGRTLVGGTGAGDDGYGIALVGNTILA